MLIDCATSEANYVRTVLAQVPSLLASPTNRVLMAIDVFLEVSHRTSAVLIDVDEIALILSIFLVVTVQNSYFMVLSVCGVIEIYVYVVR